MSYGILNAHSEHSLHQSTSKITDIIKKSKKIGATHVAVSDINTMTGCIQHIETCAVYNVRPLVSCELSILDDIYVYRIILYALNYVGFQNISHLLTMANMKLLNDDVEKPYLLYSELKSDIDHTNVIISTGGIEGMIGSVLTHNDCLKKQIRILTDKMNMLDSPNDAAYIKNKEIVEKNIQIIEMLEHKKTSLNTIAKKNYSRKKKGIQAYKGTERYFSELDKLANDMEQTELSKVELVEITKEISNLKKTTTIIKKKIKQMEISHIEYKELEARKEQIQKNIYENEESLVLQLLQKYKKIMGENFFIQVSANQVMKKLNQKFIKLAAAASVSYYITCESYMTDKGCDSNVQYMRNMDAEAWEETNPIIKEQYIMSEEDVKLILKEQLTENEIVEGLKANSEICDRIDFKMPVQKHYPKYIENNGSVCKDSAALLQTCVKEGIKQRNYQDIVKNDIYAKRLEYELSTIINMGFADYLLIVADFIKYAKNYIIENTDSHIGIAVGPGRGSAAGCLVCFFMGITNIDPIKFNLKFERFLNPNRVTMPDIDIDFSDEIRPSIIQYVTEKYGKDSVSQIRTSMTQQANASIRNAARLIGIKHGDKMKYADAADKICKLIPQKSCITDCKSNILQEFQNDVRYEDIKEIIYYAENTEGLMSSLGVHPAGVVIGDSKPLQNYIPLLYNQSLKSWVIQCDKDEAERIGLLKMDFLIVKILDKLTETIRRIYKYTGKKLDLENIPYEKEVFDNIYSNGNTQAVFQCESEGMRKVLMDFEPENIEDLILILAVYRPGPMDSIPDIIAVKKGRKKPTYCIPQLRDILEPTYGYPVYQEQIMDIFHKCAGFTTAEADIIRRYMSKKKTDKFISYKDKFIDGITGHGANHADAEKLWDLLVTFSEYAFNKSHACAYAVVSYMTAYCKYYYCAYYLCSVLNNTELEKFEALAYNAKKMGIEIMLPSVNDSSMKFENSGNCIRYGLNTIKGFNTANSEAIISERNENGRFASFKEFVIRTKISEKTIETLIEAGAADIFQECNRNQKLKSLPNLIEFRKKIKNAKSNEQIREITADIYNFNYIPDLAENADYLKIEKEKLGAYISAHPLEKYNYIYKNPSITKISDITTSECIIIGMIKNLVIRHRKKDGKPMAIYDIEDITGTIPAVSYVEEYKKYQKFIYEGSVATFSGCIKEESRDKDGEINISKKLIISKITECKTSQNPMFVSIKSHADEAYAYYALEPYKDDGGHAILLHYQDTGIIEKKNMCVNERALSLNCDRLFLKIISKL